MAGPWDKYKTAAPAASAGPWQKYKTAAPDAAPAPATQDAGPPVGTNLEQATSQGVAGVNDGLAGMLSAPNELLRAVFSVGPTLYNAVGHPGMDRPAAQPDWTSTALPDAGKAYSQVVDAVGASRAPTNNPIDKLLRSTGQAVGGALIPEIGMETAATKGAVQVGDVLKGLIPAATAGAGGGLAEQAAPGNPVAQLAGETLGAMVPGGAGAAGRALSRGSGKLPSIESLVSQDRNAGLETAKQQAYSAVDNSGARYSHDTYDALVNDIVGKATADNLNPQIHGAAASFIDKLRNAPTDFAPTLTQLDQLRQQASRDLFGDKPNSHFGKLIIDSIDNMIASDPQMAAGAGPEAASLITGARAANTRLSKTNTIDDAIQKAILNTGATGSGGNINNALRQGMKGLIDARSWTPEETQALTKIVMGSPVENGLRLAGKLSPSGNGLMAALNLGAALATHGLSTAVPVAGAVAKTAADRMTEGKVARLREGIAGTAAPAAPVMDAKRTRDLVNAIFGASVGQQ